MTELERKCRKAGGNVNKKSNIFNELLIKHFEKIMKNLLLLTFAMVSIIFISSCSDSTSPAGDPKVKVIADLATPYVNMIEKGIKNNHILENEVDSIKIVRIRVLMSRMMLFPENDNTTSGNVVKVEPFVYDISLTGGEAILATNNVPSGLYDRIKLEIHRFSTSELSQYASDPILMDFATSERYTILIEGITYIGENPSTFIFKSDAVANLSLQLEPTLNLSNGSNTTISIEVDPNFFFKKWESILDPADSKNKNDIENSLMNTIKAFKKKN